MKYHQTLRDRIVILLSRQPRTIAQLKHALGRKYDIIRQCMAGMGNVHPAGFTCSGNQLYAIKTDYYSYSDFDFRS